MTEAQMLLDRVSNFASIPKMKLASPMVGFGWMFASTCGGSEFFSSSEDCFLSYTLSRLIDPSLPSTGELSFPLEKRPSNIVSITEKSHSHCISLTLGLTSHSSRELHFMDSQA